MGLYRATGGYGGFGEPVAIKGIAMVTKILNSVKVLSPEDFKYFLAFWAIIATISYWSGYVILSLPAEKNILVLLIMVIILQIFLQNNFTEYLTSMFVKTLVAYVGFTTIIFLNDILGLKYDKIYTKFELFSSIPPSITRILIVITLLIILGILHKIIVKD